MNSSFNLRVQLPAIGGGAGSEAERPHPIDDTVVITSTATIRDAIVTIA